MTERIQRLVLPHHCKRGPSLVKSACVVTKRHVKADAAARAHGQKGHTYDTCLERRTLAVHGQQLGRRAVVAAAQGAAVQRQD